MQPRPIQSLFSVALLSMFSLAGASGQTQDTSGNSMLKGTFEFRHLAVQLVDAGFNPTDMTAVYGKITFDGAGKYTVAATSMDKLVANGAPQALNLSGTYAIGSNGIGYLTNPLYPTDQFAYINGSVAQGVFTGSSTESQGDMNTLNDIFVAVPVGTAPTNASFTAPYQTGVLDFTGANSSAIMNALFELTPNGKGGFGTISLSGQASNQNATTLSQSITGATYNFNSDGSATLTIPLPAGVSSTNAMFTGTKTIFQSADGNFILGWTTGGFDIFFGVKALAANTGTNSTSKGLYFTAALEDNPTSSGTDSYYGGTDNTGDSSGDGIIHQRINTPQPGILAYDYGVDDQFMVHPDGTTGTDLNGYLFIFGDGGQAFVAIGTQGLFSLVVGMHAPTFTGAGVYLSPIGVSSAASFQPVTASIAPGELIALYGTGLSGVKMSMQGGLAFPTSLGHVSVTIDGIPCPIYYVSPEQLSVIVPYAVALNQTGLADIQVNNNGTLSNVVQVYLTDAAPGAFSQGQDGIGFAAALHNATGTLVTKADPAQPGEYIQLYVTGLGTVTPAIMDGAVAPLTPLSWSDVYKASAGGLTVLFDDYLAFACATGCPGNIEFAGLVPTLAGLYQINVQVPTSGLGNGDSVYVEFVTDAADVNEIQIPYGLGIVHQVAPAEARRLARASRINRMRSRGRKAISRGARGDIPAVGLRAVTSGEN